MEKLRVPGVTGIDLSISDIDSPPNKLLHSENFILSSKYGNLRKRGGSIKYPLTGDIYGVSGYAKSALSMVLPMSIVPVRYRYATSTGYFEKKDDWDQEGDIVNFFTYSEQIGNAAWTKTNVTDVVASVTAPDGATTAETMRASVGLGLHYISVTTPPAGLTSGNKERLSVYIKKEGHSYISVSNCYGDALVYDFDANTSKTCYAAGGFTSYSVEGEGDGWYRFTIEFLKTDSSTRQIYVSFRENYTSSATGVGDAWNPPDGSHTIYVWGMQANDYTDLETYVLTTGAAVETPAWSNVTIHADVASSLQASGIARMAQIDNVFALFAGTPAKITDIDTGELNRLGGDAPTVAPTIAASAGAGPLTGDFYACYTYYNPTTNWESSPSPISTLLTVAAKNIEWSALPTTAVKSGVTQLRLYRTESTGEQTFYLVDTKTLGTATYTDSTTDLTLQAPDDGAHDPPPSGSYLGEAYADRLWTTDGMFSLRYSEARDGDDTNLEYWHINNEIGFNQKITGIRACERLGGLLIFKAPGYGIDLLRGTNESNFELVHLYTELGTAYDSSITVVGDDVVFWGEGRPILIRNGQMISYYSKALDDKLKDISLVDYNMSSFAWSFWHPTHRQVFWGVAGYSSDGSSWSESSSGLFAEWEGLTTGAPALWQ